MCKKTASLWRSLRTPILLTSVTALIIGCASQNPLMDEAVPSVTAKSASATPEETITEEKAVTSGTEIKVPAATTDRELVKRADERESELNTRPTGVKKWLSFFTPYKVNVQQGNFISSEMLAKIQPGMTKEQVRFVLGTPLLTDMFHADRWDYLFRLQKTNGAITTNRVTVFFKESVVERVSNDPLPDEAEYLAHISSDDEPSDTPVKAASSEKTKQENASVKTTTEETGGLSEATGASEQANASESVITSEPANASESTGRSEPTDTPDSASTPEPISTLEPVSTSEPVSTPEPISTPEPVSLPEVAGTAEPVVISGADSPSEAVSTAEPVGDSEQIKPLKSSVEQTVSRTEQSTDVESVERSASERIGVFEPISVSRRVGKMTPVSPNDQLIGNIQ